MPSIFLFPVTGTAGLESVMRVFFVNAYLTFNGNCEKAFNFYKSVFGGDFAYVGRFRDMPTGEACEGYSLPEELKDKIMHIAYAFTPDCILMGSDTFPPYSPEVVQGNNFTLSINVDTAAEAKRIFNELSNGGVVHMPLEKTFWAEPFGMFTDKFGINWMVN